ncbi:MAG: DNA polymerase III subunit gamma/tau [Deltaproteobacteria bacterium]|nr:DNA polymerase III subunit gamma/tau [Deltaproteobacteria bacterium]
MAYQVLARKYRPQSFEEVLGQETTVKTLTNAIAQKRLHQAYLFCGARGVGKTSLARILAKSLNCERGLTPTGSTIAPCQTCTACVGITQSNSLDVREIDGASNTGVDDVRELREQVKYLPTGGKYKIYIIDEVHMLSQAAFNALLKTLEEPPPHVIFIFATTEPHKIPVTILSRCQRFDFKRLSVPQLVGHLKNILAREKIAVDEEGLTLVASCSEGSVRDSLSLLDQVISFCGAGATPDQVREILGLADRALLFATLEALLKEDVRAVLKQAQSVYEQGFDLKIFSEGLLEMIRHCLVMAEGGDEFVDLPPAEKERIKKMASLIPAAKYLTLFQILARGVEDLARSDFPKMAFEVTLLKMLRAKELMSIPEILERLETQGSSQQASSSHLSPPLRGGDKGEGGTRASPSPLPGDPPNATGSSEVGADTDSAPKSLNPPLAARLGNPPLKGEGVSGWTNFVKKVLEVRPQVGAILEHARPLAIRDDSIDLGFEPKSLYADMLRERIEMLQEVAGGYFKKPVKFGIRFLGETGGAPASARELREEEEKKKKEALTARALADPMVQKAQELLGAKLKEVKEIK